MSAATEHARVGLAWRRVESVQRAADFRDFLELAGLADAGISLRWYRRTGATVIARGIGTDAAAVFLGHTSSTITEGHYIEPDLSIDPTPAGHLQRTAATAAGTALAASGLATCSAGMRRFAGTSELTGTRNQALTTTGIYRYSRNPQYVGYVTVLAGAALSRRRGAALALTGLLAVTYALWVPVEENHLRDLHGEAYEDYQRRTHRWWGRPRHGSDARHG